MDVSSEKARQNICDENIYTKAILRRWERECGRDARLGPIAAAIIGIDELPVYGPAITFKAASCIAHTLK